MNRKSLEGAIARSLREFGYPDVSTEMIGEVWDAYAAGKTGFDLPHGVVGMMAESQLDEIAEARPDILTRNAS